MGPHSLAQRLIICARGVTAAIKLSIHFTCLLHGLHQPKVCPAPELRPPEFRVTLKCNYPTIAGDEAFVAARRGLTQRLGTRRNRHNCVTMGSNAGDLLAQSRELLTCKRSIAGRESALP
eukprot:CAMPEP_0204373504 /NCGR_PEP_ID=MMETSP0469-20131031/48088_1 /ASSEMBLY_ACC=CAM_ASM_000384 /TAXON_ID=2969 /ORGANISM="Oxyrrhis marina" /LENGTH=119 /DNA_ID=CAMNT_0051363991 /DNA_START=48 /DNA_END=407 /DNA_ORIENTATION=+